MFILKYLAASLLATAMFSTTSIEENYNRVIKNDVEAGKSITLHGWLPFWAKASGTVEMLNHEEYFSSISPFSMEVSQGGFLFNRFENDAVIKKIVERDRKYKIIPTIAWFDADEIDETLSSSTQRAFHIGEITRVVNSKKYDGIDIDYEGKYLRTKDSYSLFIKELSGQLHKNKKLLYCTVESRTPSEDIYINTGRQISHATDYKVLDKYCDSVRIMAYDQRDADVSLVIENKGTFYRPVADPAWVEKAIKEAIYEIDRKKLVVGIPTYGNIYKKVVEGERIYYSYVSAINYNNAKARALENGVTPLRNKAGELEFSYSKDGITYYVSFSDAVSVKKKLLLAEKYGLSGVSIFKIDGGMDKDIWAELNRKIKLVKK